MAYIIVYNIIMVQLYKYNHDNIEILFKNINFVVKMGVLYETIFAPTRNALLIEKIID